MQDSVLLSKAQYRWCTSIWTMNPSGNSSCWPWWPRAGNSTAHSPSSLGLRTCIQTHLKTCVLQWQYEISQQASKLTITFKLKSCILQSWARIQVLDKYIRQAAFSHGNCNLAHIMNQESNLHWFVLVLILYSSASFRWHFLSLDELEVDISCRDKSDKHKELSLSNERFQNRKS